MSDKGDTPQPPPATREQLGADSLRVLDRRLHRMTRMRIIVVLAGGVIGAAVFDVLNIQPLILKVALMALVACILGIIALIFAERMLDSLLEPLHELWQGTTELSRGEYSHRIHEAEGDLGDLTAEFNRMAERLQQGKAAQEEWVRSMEELVDLRARQLARKSVQLQTAAEVSSKITTILDRARLLDEIIQLIKQRFQYESVRVYLVDHEKRAILPTREAQAVPIPLDSEKSVVAHVAVSGETVRVADVRREPRYMRLPEFPVSQSELAVPLKAGNQVIGVLNIESGQRYAFSGDVVDVMETLGNQIAVAMQNAALFGELEQANQEQKRLMQAAQEMDILKQRFLLNVSHKLRTPLNAILGLSETIMAGLYGPLNEKMADRQSRILENARHLNSLINDLLDLSVIEVGSADLHCDWVDVPALIERCVEAARDMLKDFPDHQVEIEQQIGADLPAVWGDKDRLRQILLNLLSNAVKFTPKGKIQIQAQTTDEALLIQVTDTGTGIEPAEQEKLFVPFGSLALSHDGQVKASGIGLAASHKLAHLHNGDLTVESTPGKGSAFTLRLPRTKPESTFATPGATL